MAKYLYDEHHCKKEANRLLYTGSLAAGSNYTLNDSPSNYKSILIDSQDNTSGSRFGYIIPCNITYSATDGRYILYGTHIEMPSYFNNTPSSTYLIVSSFEAIISGNQLTNVRIYKCRAMNGTFAAPEVITLPNVKIYGVI